jgi:hypothetical protein
MSGRANARRSGAALAALLLALLTAAPAVAQEPAALAACLRVSERACLLRIATALAEAVVDPRERTQRLADLTARLAELGEPEPIPALIAGAAQAAAAVTDPAARDDARLALALRRLAARHFDAALAEVATLPFADMLMGMVVVEAANQDRAFAERALPQLSPPEQARVRGVLALAYAADGDAARAKALAEAVLAAERGELVAQIVKIIADKARTHAAMTLAWDISDGIELHFAMAAAVVSMAERTIFGDGQALVDVIPHKPAQDVGLAALARAHARAGDLDAAMATAERIDVVRRAPTLTAIAAAQAASGDVAGALQAARRMNENSRVLTLAAVAKALLDAGNSTGARAALNELGTETAMLPSSVAGWARAGDPARAIALAQAIENATTRAGALLDAVEAAPAASRSLLEAAEAIPLTANSEFTRRAAVAWAPAGAADVAAMRMTALSERARFLALLTLLAR